MVKFSSLALAGLLTAGCASAADGSMKCLKGLRLFAARGTYEEMDDSKSKYNVTKTSQLGNTMGLGVLANLLKPIMDQVEDSNYTAILYPAWSGSDADNMPNYFQSVANGTLLVTEAMTTYAKDCPDSKMAFFGYSQGAHIISNTLCGAPPVWPIFAVNGIPKQFFDPMDSNITKNIVATVLLGDPSGTKGASYQYGTHNNSGNGMFYRDDISKCEELGQRIRSYCDAGDPFCDIGKTFSEAHGLYITKYSDDIIKYVVDQFNNGGQTGDVKSSTEKDEKDDEAKDNTATGINMSWSLAVIASIVSIAFL